MKWKAYLSPVSVLIPPCGLSAFLRMGLLPFVIVSACCNNGNDGLITISQDDKYTSKPITLIECDQLSDTRVYPFASVGYEPSAVELRYYNKADCPRYVPRSILEKYSINNQVGCYVAWFGIVRHIENRNELLIEHKHFNGITDPHQITVSWNGSGDFKAQLLQEEWKHGTLKLVRVYGKVIDEVGSIPRVAAEYIRVWPWGRYAFIMEYGNDHTNPKWRLRNTVPVEKIYSHRPDREYYVRRLGTPE